MGIRGELFSTRVLLQNRTYFFNVKENRLGDLYLNIVESKNKETGGFDRQSVVLFADDLGEFLQGFNESLRVLEKASREKQQKSGRPKPGPRPGPGAKSDGFGPRPDSGDKPAGEKRRFRSKRTDEAAPFRGRKADEAAPPFRGRKADEAGPPARGRRKDEAAPRGRKPDAPPSRGKRNGEAGPREKRVKRVVRKAGPPRRED